MNSHKNIQLTGIKTSSYIVIKTLNNNNLFVLDLSTKCVHNCGSKYITKNKKSLMTVNLLIPVLLPISVACCKNK